jgi:hypothetical protein
MTEADPAAAYTALRAETVRLLGLDPAGTMSLAQDLQVDLLALLRLEVDTLNGRVLAGEAVDLNRLSVAFGMLQKLLPPAELKAETCHHDFSGAREELERLLEGRAYAIQCQHERESAIEAEVAAGFYRDCLRPPALPRPSSPPPRAHVAYIDAGVVDDPSPPAPAPANTRNVTRTDPVPVSVAAPPPTTSGDAEWLRWYRAGGSTRQAGWDSPPKGW